MKHTISLPTADKLLSINEASKTCGLSASLLRIWELRYGWPDPIRHANGYRGYPPSLIEELKLIAERHRQGLPVRDLIRDGRPVLPPAKPKRPCRKLSLDYTKSLPAGSTSVARQLRKELIQALETRRIGQVDELQQRASWLLRRDDEVASCLVPIIAGLAELARQKRPMTGNLEALDTAVTRRCQQLHRQITTAHDDRLIIVAPTSGTESLAAIVCALLALRGLDVEIRDRPDMGTPWLRVGPHGKSDADRHPHYLGRIAILPEKHAWDLRQLLEAHRLPWQPVAA